MSGALLTPCFWFLLVASADEARSGRPLSTGCSGLVDCLLFLHEEYYIRVGECFNGTVVAIDGDTVTVKCWRRVARVFRVSPILTSDRIPLPQYKGGHRLSQLRVGDTGGLVLSLARDGPVCTGLAIGRRPGGVIPQAEDDYVPVPIRLHIRLNLKQILEDKVIPALRVTKVFAR